MAGATPIDDHSSPGVVKHEDPFSYDSQMMLDGSIAPSLTTYQSLGFALQEHTPSMFDCPVRQTTANSLSSMLIDPAPFQTVAPSATSGGSEVSAYKLSVGMAELSISSPASSPFFPIKSAVSSPPLLQQEQIQACDPKVLDSPLVVQPSPFLVGSPAKVGEARHNKVSIYSAPTVDSDYSPSGESEVEDESDYTYQEPLSRKSSRSARVSSAAHPYLQPAKVKGKKGRGTKLEIPVPVPGLTKNSRGRSVPKKAETIVFPDGTRAFWCNVQDCDKLFSRGEHLKRHITSIHTNDKSPISFPPSSEVDVLTDRLMHSDFRCQCSNTFSRRDNLFQHMRARGCQKWFQDGPIKSPVVNKSTKKKCEVDTEADDYLDPIVVRIMADAKIAKAKRDEVCKQMWALS